jgi:hypothetical protein
MPDFDPQLAIALLRSHPQTLGTTAQEQDAYIQKAAALLGSRSPEDRREAAKLAVETTKMFLTISIGVLVATFAWMQFAHSNAGLSWVSWTILPFYGAAVLLAFSMINGFVAISRIYKRADGREAANQPAWSTEHIAGVLNKQAMSGIVALLVLFAGVLMLGLSDQASKEAVTVTIPGKAGPTPSGSLMIEGVWTELRLKTASQQEIKLPQQTLPVTVTCK